LYRCIERTVTELNYVKEFFKQEKLFNERTTIEKKEQH